MNSAKKSSKKKLPISALVVTFNEEHLISKCLNSIDFCEEILVVDLGSNDRSVELAKSFGGVIFEHERLPSSEYLRPIYVPKLMNDWVLIIDPDEYLTQNLKEDILQLFRKIEFNNEISNIVVPWVFYFGKKQLKGTPWGGKNRKTLIVNRNNFSFVPQIHNGQRKSPDSLEIVIGDLSKNSFLHHSWMINRRQFLEKHSRYLKAEGFTRYENDQNPRFIDLIIAPFKEFLWAFFIKKGYLDGALGIYLCFFWAKYQTLAKLHHLMVAKWAR